MQLDNVVRAEKMQSEEGERKEGKWQGLQGRSASSDCRERRREAETGRVVRTAIIFLRPVSPL